MRISDWSSDVCSSDLERVIGERRREFHREIELAIGRPAARLAGAGDRAVGPEPNRRPQDLARIIVERGAQIEHQMRRLPRREGIAMHADARARGHFGTHRSEEHTSELQSLMRISYAVFCLKKKKKNHENGTQANTTRNKK